MEFLRKFFAEPTPRQRTGYIQGAGIDGRSLANIKVIVPPELPIWIHSVDSITGDVPGDSKGLIESTHGRINLTIGSPLEYLVSDPVKSGLRRKKIAIHGTSSDQMRSSEFWSSGSMSSAEEENLFNIKSWQDAASEQRNQVKRIDNMLKQLSRLQINQAEQALKILEDLKRKEAFLKEQVGSRTEELSASDAKLMGLIELAEKQLIISSLNGDINLRISDPDLRIVIPDRNNQREDNSVLIAGTPPSNPAREASVFTFRGRIAITYLNQST